MKPTERIKIVTNIALRLQAEYNTTQINVFLSGYNIPTENISVVNSKRVYVFDLLKSQSNEKVLQIANDLEIETPQELNMQFQKEGKINLENEY